MSGNALKHGLLRKKLKLMPDESRYMFNKLNTTLRDQWNPTNAIEFMLVEQLAFNYWRLKRAFTLETELLEKATQEADNWKKKTLGKARPEVYVTEFLDFERFDKFSRYITSIQRQNLRILRELQKLRGINSARIDETNNGDSAHSSLIS